MASKGKAAAQLKTSASSSSKPKPVWKSKLTQKRASLQYRATSNEPWQTMESSYEVEDIEEAHPEPPNIQEITLAATGIIIHQYSAPYPRASIKELVESLPGWELEFPASAMKDFVCEQRKVDSWVGTAPPGAQRTIDSIRFQLVEQPKSSDCSIFVKPIEDAGEDTGEEAGEEAGEKAGEDTGAAMELDPKAAEFPLATLDLQAGMEIRLAFEGGSTTRVTKGPYFWIWPMVIHILAGRHYNAAEKNQNQAELNVRNLLSIDNPK
ncbi:MAG: hypothetical protein Q9171_001861 [Xanthocarpia ochracea]